MPTTTNIVESVLRVRDEATKKLERIEKSAGKTGNMVDGLASKLKGLAAPLAAAFGLARSITGAKEYVAQIERIQALTNMSANNIAGMTHAMQISGLQATDMEMIFENMAVKQADFKRGMAGAVEQSKRLGVDLRQGPQQQLIEMARLVEQGKLGTAGVREMTQASGPALIGLMDLLRKGSKDVTALLEEGRQKNRHITNDTVKSFKKFDTMMTKVKLAWVRISTIVLSKLMPGLTSTGMKFEKIIDSWAEGAATVGSVIASVGGFLAKHGTLLMTLVKALLIMKAGKMIGGFFINQANQISSMFGAMAKNAGGVNKGLGGMIGKLGRSSIMLAMFSVALQGIAKWVDEQQEKGIKATVRMGRVRELAPQAATAAAKIATRGARGETLLDLAGQKDMRNQVRKYIEEGVLTGMISINKKTKQLYVDREKAALRFLETNPFGGIEEAEQFAKNAALMLKVANKDASMLSNLTLRRLKLTEVLARRERLMHLQRMSFMDQMIFRWKELSKPFGKLLFPFRRKPVETPGEREKNVINQDFRGSRFDIRQDFAEGFDPTRVATVMANDLASLGERRLQSGLAPLFAVR